MWSIWKQLPSNLIRRDLLKKVIIFRGPYHNFTGIPNFVANFNKYEYTQDHNPENVLLSEESTIVAAKNLEDIPQELKHLKVEENEEIYTPFSERKKIFKWTPHNKLADKLWKKYYK